MATIAELEEAVQQLRQQLQESESERMKAAQYGLELLKNEAELDNKLTETTNEFAAARELLEQEKYSLQREVELKNRMLESLTSDIESIKQQQKTQLSQQLEQVERIHVREINELKTKLEKQKSELDEAQLCEKQLRHKVDHQSELLNAKSEELRNLSERAQETMSSEMMSLQVENMELEAAKAKLQEDFNEMIYHQEQLELANNNLQRQIERLQTEKEEQEKEIVSYCNALEKAREANQDLQIQLDQALQEARDPSSKGNSLFAEVEDRRAMMERQLIGLRIQYQSLQKQHAFSRQQLHRMKVQIATMLQIKGLQSDPGQLERLQSMLAQKNNEIQALVVKLRRLEKMEMNYDSGENHNEVDAADFGDGQYYVELLKQQIDNAKKENRTVNDELSLQRMKALAESQRVLEVERKFYANERQLKQYQSENMKLRVKLDEMRLKYEPEEVKNRTQNCKKERLPVEVHEEARLVCSVTAANEMTLSSDKVTETRKRQTDVLHDENSIPVCSITPANEMTLSSDKVTETRKRQTDMLHNEKSTPLSKTEVQSTPSLDPLSANDTQITELELDSKQTPKEGKRVRIMQEAGEVQVLSERWKTEVSRPTPSPRISKGDLKVEKPVVKELDKESEEVKGENKIKRQKIHPVIHVSSQPTVESQCAQQ
ncbi:protein Spindly [Hypanus sabinus]|uniref:protein Spindly n=1 Tax=Hypanus sabinus TaxID=79690 RepID=UPI0028C463E1|nr:protein Spindly [Hypanus sabinus]XP_059800813.1 protein Spindly [Hypanus sabinus]